MLSLASRFTVNPILLPVENDPFRSQLLLWHQRSYIGLHSPLDLQFHQKAAVLTTDASRKNFCLRHLAVVAKSATNAQVTMSRNLNFSETNTVFDNQSKSLILFKSIVLKILKILMSKCKGWQGPKGKKKLERLRAQAFNFVRLLLYF